MTQARQGLRIPSLHRGAADDSDEQIPWLDTDPKRAPLRNDVVSALQVALCPIVFWFVFMTPNYNSASGAAVAASVAMVLIFGAAFTYTWARMASARRRSATLRSPRAKVSLALRLGLVIGVATIWTSTAGFADRPVQFLLGVVAGVSAFVILLALESFAVSVPAAERPAAKPKVIW